MATSREIGGSNTGLGVTTVRLSVTDVPSTSGIGVPFSFDIPPLTDSNAPFATQFVNLSSGNNAISVPVNAVAVFICPPQSNTTLWTIRGVNGDTGVGPGTSAAAAWAFFPCSTSFVVNSAAAINGVFIGWF